MCVEQVLSVPRALRINLMSSFLLSLRLSTHTPQSFILILSITPLFTCTPLHHRYRSLIYCHSIYHMTLFSFLHHSLALSINLLFFRSLPFSLPCISHSTPFFFLLFVPPHFSTPFSSSSSTFLCPSFSPSQLHRPLLSFSSFLHLSFTILPLIMSHYTNDQKKRWPYSVVLFFIMK